MISIIVAMDKNGCIGKNNTLPWHHSEDMKFFKELTWDNSVLMGRKTFESIGSKPLPGRTNFVLTRKSPVGSSYKDGVFYVENIQQVFIQYATFGSGQLFVIGGAQTYKLMSSVAREMFVTRINKEVKPSNDNIYFPLLNKELDKYYREFDYLSKIKIFKDGSEVIHYYKKSLDS